MFATVGVVTLISAVLILGGVSLFSLTIWFWRTSRPESTALAPLEIMSERAYKKSWGVDREFLLHRVRSKDSSHLEDNDVIVPQSAGETN